MLTSDLSYVGVVLCELLAFRYFNNFKVARGTRTHVCRKYLAQLVLAHVLVVNAVVYYVDVVVYCLVSWFSARFLSGWSIYVCSACLLLI